MQIGMNANESEEPVPVHHCVLPCGPPSCKALLFFLYVLFFLLLLKRLQAPGSASWNIIHTMNDGMPIFKFQILLPKDINTFFKYYF